MSSKYSLSVPCFKFGHIRQSSTGNIPELARSQQLCFLVLFPTTVLQVFKDTIMFLISSTMSYKQTMKYKNYFSLYFIALEKSQAGIYFPTPLIHSLGEKKKNRTKQES